MTRPAELRSQAGHRPWPLPRSPWVMTQRWHDLLFAHWSVPARELRERIPPALVTRDQLRMLEGPDNVVTDGGASMRRLGLGDLVGLDEQLRRAAAAAGREMQRHG